MLAIAVLPAGLLLIAIIGGLVVACLPSSDTGRSARSGLSNMEGEPFALRPTMALLSTLAAGLVVIFPLGLGLGQLVEQLQSVDTWVFNWFADQRQQWWYDAMETTTQLGNSWLNRGVAVGVLLTLVAVVRYRWLTAFALVAMLFAAHYMIVLTTSVIDRTPPPGSGGTYPSGGCARVVAVYGLVAFVLLRETGAGRKVSAVVWTVVAALSFVEAYSRAYLAAHWLSDTLGGLIFGGLLLGIFIVALRVATRQNPLAASSSSAISADRHALRG